MAKKAFKHMTPSAFNEPAAPPVPIGIRPLFLPSLLQDAALRIRQSQSKECAHAHAVFKKWIENIETGLLDALTETQVEQDFYKTLLGSLGYTTQADGEPGQPWTMTPKWREFGADTADATLGHFEWDESLGLVGRANVVVEVKGASQDLDRRPTKGRSPVQQAWGYLNDSETAQWALVSNYREFRLYSRLRPSRYVHRVVLTDLKAGEQFAQFYAVFHAAGLLGAAPISWSAAALLAETGSRQEAVGDKLYEFYTVSRAALIREIQGRRKVDLNQAIQAAQRLLDRILFIAFAQARDLLSDRQLLEKTYNTRIPGLNRWMAFQLLFRAIDSGDEMAGVPRYNGNLFKPDPLLDDPAFQIDPERWPLAFKNLGAYDYQNEVTVDVLGRIFERSITDIEDIKAAGLGEHEAELANMAGKGRRKAQGVYYTATFVVEYLIGAALDPLLERRKDGLIEQFGLQDGVPDPPPAQFTRALLNWLDAVTLCDPACGSGAFLTEAYNWFETNRCDLLRDLHRAEPDAPECHDEKGLPGTIEDWRACSAPIILKNNLHGVDLSKESVEIAQLSLWIRTARRGQLLTDLSANVVVGNSVVDDRAVDPDHAFDWKAHFSSVFIRGGFDAVVGNPPYVRQERLTAFKAHWKQRFSEVFDPIADLYVYFFGRGLEILQPGGRLAFICSNSFARAAFGTSLRTYLQTKVALERYLDLGDTQVFKDAKDVYPALIVLEKRPPQELDRVQSLRIRRTEEVTQVAKLARERSHSIPLAQLSPAAWQFEDTAVFRLREKVASHRNLNDYVDGNVFRGLITGLNEAFVVNSEIKHDIESRNPASRGLFKPFKGGEDLRRWYQEESGKWLIHLPNGITSAHSQASTEAEGWAWLQDTYPAIAEHLKGFEDRARRREDQGQFWWELRACDYDDAFERPKIVYPDIAKSTRFSIDRGGSFLGNTAYFIPGEDDYLLAVLNSAVTWFVLSGISIPFGERAGEFRYRLFTQYLSQVPIPMPADVDRAGIAALARQASEWGRERYELTERVAHRLEGRFRLPSLIDTRLSEKLRDWSRLSFGDLGLELKKAFKLPQVPWDKPALADEWETYMKGQYARHADLSHRLASAEEEINRRVYKIFELTPDDVKRLESEIS